MESLPTELVELVVLRAGPACAPVCKLFRDLVRRNVFTATGVAHELPPLPKLRRLELSGPMTAVAETVRTLDVQDVSDMPCVLDVPHVSEIRIRRRDAMCIRAPERIQVIDLVDSPPYQTAPLPSFPNLRVLRMHVQGLDTAFKEMPFAGLTRLDICTTCAMAGAESLEPIARMASLTDLTLRGIRCCDIDDGMIGLDHVPAGVERLHVLVEYGRGNFGDLREYARLTRLKSLIDLVVPRIPIGGVPESLRERVANTRGKLFYEPMPRRTESVFEFFVRLPRPDVRLRPTGEALCERPSPSCELDVRRVEVHGV
jgi:hypothetical protein